MVLYQCSIPVGLKPGFSIRIQGCAEIEGNGFNINLQSGSLADCATIPFHLSVRFDEATLIRNTRRHFEWEVEESEGPLPINKGQLVDILIKVEEQAYIVEIDGQYFCEFLHRIPISTVNHIQIGGDVEVHRVTINSESCEYFYSQIEGTSIIQPTLTTIDIGRGVQAVNFDQ